MIKKENWMKSVLSYFWRWAPLSAGGNILIQIVSGLCKHGCPPGNAFSAPWSGFQVETSSLKIVLTFSIWSPFRNDWELIVSPKWCLCNGIYCFFKWMIPFYWRRWVNGPERNNISNCSILREYFCFVWCPPVADLAQWEDQWMSIDQMWHESSLRNGTVIVWWTSKLKLKQSHIFDIACSYRNMNYNHFWWS